MSRDAQATRPDSVGQAHTPGPWHVRHCSGTIAVRGRRGVCVVHWYGPKGGEQHLRAVADAELIAAAPELLEVLQTVRDWVSDAASGQSFFSHAPAYIVELAAGDLSRIDAAIAKAKGGQP